MKGGVDVKKSLGLLLLIVVIVALILTGCGMKSTKGGEGTLRVVIEWGSFKEAPQIKSSMARETNEVEDMSYVTHTGVRVIYPGNNAAYSQSVTREIAETQGIITLQIPSTDDAQIYVLAVHDSTFNWGRRVLQMGWIESFPIPADNITTITMDDINWIEAKWYPGEGYENYENELIVSKDKKQLDMPIYIRDPFQVGKEVSYEQSVIKITGASRCGENTDGWRHFDILHENSKVGEVHAEAYKFQPGIDHILFNLPAGRY